MHVYNGPSFGTVHSHSAISCESSPLTPLNVTMNKASGEISTDKTPFLCGEKNVFIGNAVFESQMTIIESIPASPVTIHFLSSLTHEHDIGLH